MKSYRMFNIALLITIPSVLVLYVAAIYFYYTDEKDNSFSIETYFKFKDGAAQQIKGDKILFSSGSNNFLGIRASRIEDNFNVPTVNLSIHAGLGTTYIIERVKRVAKEGDMVILPLEYGNLTFDGNESVVLNKYLLSYDKPYFNTRFDFTEKLSILSSISILDLLSNAIDPLSEEEKAQLRSKFLKDLNKNGDMLNMTQHDPLRTIMNPFKLPDPIDKETMALKTISNFNTYCKEHAIYLYITFPNIVDDEAYGTEKYNAYFRFLKSYFKKNQIPVLGAPQDGMYERELFFDSEYHLISKGSDIRTADFIEIMNKDETLLKRINGMKKH